MSRVGKRGTRRDSTGSSKKKEANWCKRCQHAPTEVCAREHPQRLGYSTPYRRGRGFEYSVINALRKQGCYCFRSYGSKGTFDIGVIPPRTAADPRPMVIQAKRSSGKIDDHELAHMIIVGRDLAARVIIATRDENRRITFKEVLINRTDK